MAAFTATALLLVISTGIFLLPAAEAAVNGPCSVGSTPGVCLDTGVCSSGGGTYASGYCPNDPTNVKCCYKTSCSTGGSCKWTSQCTGSTVSGLCPGPTDFKCCIPRSVPVPVGSTDTAKVVTFADSQWNCDTVACGTRVSAGTLQPHYECAEFVSRSLVAGGFITGLSSTGSSSTYQNYKYQGVAYNLLHTSSKQSNFQSRGVGDLLLALGWRVVSVSTANVHAASVIFSNDGDGIAYGHVGIGVGENLIDAHNKARYHITLGGFGTANAIYVK